MEDKQREIQAIQSLEDLNAIEEELKQTILLLRNDISLSREEFDVISKQYHEKWHLIYLEIEEKERIIEQICARRAVIGESRRKCEEERLESTKRMRTEEEWRKIIDERTKEGFPESNEEVLELFAAYSHVSAAEEEIDHAMALLMEHNRKKGLNSPFWINKTDEDYCSNGYTTHLTCEDVFVLLGVEAQPNGIAFWMDDSYYYLQLALSCGCVDESCREFGYGESEKCDELYIQFPKESDTVALCCREKGIIRIDREACPYNGLILLDFSVLLKCDYNECESAPMSMVFAPCYLKKHYLREHNDALCPELQDDR